MLTHVSFLQHCELSHTHTCIHSQVLQSHKPQWTQCLTQSTQPADVQSCMNTSPATSKRTPVSPCAGRQKIRSGRWCPPQQQGTVFQVPYCTQIVQLRQQTYKPSKVILLFENQYSFNMWK